MSKKPFDYSAAKELKAIGAIAYDLRKQFTKWQRENIRNKFKEYKGYIKNPNDYFTPIVKRQSAKNLKKSGYSVTGKGRAIIPKSGYDSVQMSRDKEKLLFRKKGEKSVTYLANGKTSALEILESLKNKKLSRREMITVRIGDNNPFHKTFFDYASLLYYMQNEFEPNDDDESPEEIWPLISIVHIERVKPIRQARKNTKGTPVKTSRRKS